MVDEMFLERLDKNLQSNRFSSTPITVEDWKRSDVVEKMLKKPATKRTKDAHKLLRRVDGWLEDCSLLREDTAVLADEKHSEMIDASQDGSDAIQSKRKKKKMKNKIRSLSFSKTKNIMFPSGEDKKNRSSEDNIKSPFVRRNAFRKDPITRSVTNLSDLFVYTKIEHGNVEKVENYENIRHHPHTVHTIRKSFQRSQYETSQRSDGQSWNSQYYKFEYV